MKNDFLTTEELCSTLKVTRQCIYKWRKEGMPSYSFGRLIRFKYDEVLEWLNKR